MTVSAPIVKVAVPRRMMNVSAYGWRCSRGPTPSAVVDSRMIEIPGPLGRFS
jgi:hypothetical protein